MPMLHIEGFNASNVIWCPCITLSMKCNNEPIHASNQLHCGFEQYFGQLEWL
jgi:hypothetical protein